MRPEDTIARLGGDEFAVMIPGVGDPLIDGRAVARRILKAFELPVEAGTELVSVHLSIGLASSAQSGDGDELIRNADVAMYQAKSKGKGRFELFEPQMAAAILRRHDLKEELAKAIERQQMIVQYQPIVALDSGRIVAAEALVRWEHPSRGLVPPGDFVPLAEETGLIVPLGRFVLREACRQARRWQDAETESGVEPLRMHVNLSVAELRDPDLVKNVLASITEAGIDPQQLVIEITESQLLAAASRGALPRAARAGHQDRARRLRHRLQLAVVPALAAAGHAEDRQAVHRRVDERSPRELLRRHDRRPRQDARARSDRRGHRDLSAARRTARDERRPRPGVLPRAPERSRAAARRARARCACRPGA